MGIKENFKEMIVTEVKSTLLSVECSCDVCGKTEVFSGDDYQISEALETFGTTVEVYAGYGSVYDGLTMSKTFCWPCFMSGVNKPQIVKSCDGISSWEEFDEPYAFEDDSDIE